MMMISVMRALRAIRDVIADSFALKRELFRRYPHVSDD